MYLKAQIAKGGEAGASASFILAKYSDDEERDEHGRWASGGGKGDSPLTESIKSGLSLANDYEKAGSTEHGGKEELETALSAAKAGDQAVRDGNNEEAAMHYSGVSDFLSQELGSIGDNMQDTHANIVSMADSAAMHHEGKM